jgi:hypothetical protein
MNPYVGARFQSRTFKCSSKFEDCPALVHLGTGNHIFDLPSEIRSVIVSRLTHLDELETQTCVFATASPVAVFSPRESLQSSGLLNNLKGTLNQRSSLTSVLYVAHTRRRT